MEERNKEEESLLGEVKEGTQKVEGKPEKNGEKTSKEDADKKNVEMLKEQLSQLRDEKDKWMNKYYQELADVQNLRKEIQRDNQSLLEYRAMPFIEKLVPFMNSMDMAFKSEPKDPAVKSWIDGIHMSYKQLWQVMAEEGLTEIDPKVGDEFDPAWMQSMQTVDGEKDDAVAQVFMKGYKLKNRLVSPAMVVVTKKVEKKPEDEKKDDTK
mgnify:FL=1